MPQASKKAAEGFAAFKAPTQKELTERLEAKLLHHFSVQPEEATNENLYNALVLVLRDLMRERRVAYISETHKENAKQVYYLCMEFLMGRSLKNTLYNLNMTGAAEKVMRQWGVKLDTLYELEYEVNILQATSREVGISCEGIARNLSRGLMSSGNLDIETVDELICLKCEVQYDIDSKGFYRPLYLIDCTADGESVEVKTSAI